MQRTFVGFKGSFLAMRKLRDLDDDMVSQRVSEKLTRVDKRVCFTDPTWLHFNAQIFSYHNISLTTPTQISTPGNTRGSPPRGKNSADKKTFGLRSPQP